MTRQTHDFPPGCPCGRDTPCRWCEAMGDYFEALDPSTAGSREIAQHTAAVVRRDLREESK